MPSDVQHKERDEDGSDADGMEAGSNPFLDAEVPDYDDGDVDDDF